MHEECKKASSVCHCHAGGVINISGIVLLLTKTNTNHVLKLK